MSVFSALANRVGTLFTVGEDDSWHLDYRSSDLPVQGQAWEYYLPSKNLFNPNPSTPSYINSDVSWPHTPRIPSLVTRITKKLLGAAATKRDYIQMANVVCILVLFVVIWNKDYNSNRRETSLRALLRLIDAYIDPEFQDINPGSQVDYEVMMRMIMQLPGLNLQRSDAEILLHTHRAAALRLGTSVLVPIAEEVPIASVVGTSTPRMIAEIQMLTLEELYAHSDDLAEEIRARRGGDSRSIQFDPVSDLRSAGREREERMRELEFLYGGNIEGEGLAALYAPTHTLRDRLREHDMENRQQSWAVAFSSIERLRLETERLAQQVGESTTDLVAAVDEAAENEAAKKGRISFKERRRRNAEKSSNSIQSRGSTRKNASSSTIDGQIEDSLVQLEQDRAEIAARRAARRARSTSGM